MNSTPKKLISHNMQANNGFSLIEVILASSVFILLVTALVGAYLYGQESTALAGSRARATLLAEEGLEAVRNIRDFAWNENIYAQTGISDSTGSWSFLGQEIGRASC